jgi:hypothetical protein
MGPLQAYWQALRGFSPSMRRLLLAMSLVPLATFGLVPVLQNLYLLRLGYDAQFIGLLVGLGQVVWAAAALPAGMASNRIGLRNGLVTGLGLMGLGLTILLLAEAWPQPQWQAWLMGSQVLWWLGAAFAVVNIPPYMMAVTGEQERRYAFAVQAALLPAMAFVGSMIGGLAPGLLAGRLGVTLDQPAPYRLALGLAPILLWGACLVLAGADPARVARPATQRQGDGRAPLALLAFFGLVTFLGATGEGTVRAFFSIYLDTELDVAPAAIGSVMGLAQLLPIGAALAVPFLVARRGTGNALGLGLLGMGVFLVPLAAFPMVGIAGLAYMGIITMSSLIGPVRDMFGQEIVTSRWRTISQSAATTGMALGWAAAGIVGGALIKASGFSTLYFAGALAALLAAGLVAGYVRWTSKRPATALELAPLLSNEAELKPAVSTTLDE